MNQLTENQLARIDNLEKACARLTKTVALLNKELKGLKACHEEIQTDLMELKEKTTFILLENI